MAEEKQTPQPDVPQVTPAAQVRDKRILPEGVVPKQAQAYVVAALALLILMAVLFSKNHARPSPKEPAPTPVSVSNDMNQQRIHELEQDLSADQRQSQQQAQAPMSGATAVAGSAASGSGAAQTNINPAGPSQEPAQPPRDPIADAEKALAFKARFASNLVTSAGTTASAGGDVNVQANHPHASPANRPEDLPQQASASQTAAAASKRAPEVNIDRAHGRPYVIFEGVTIDTVLTNRLDSDFAGPVKVMVTNPVYSRDRQHVLIPAGTFILGNAQKIGSMGQRRLAVAFHRMIMPDGYSVDLDQFHGLDQIGDTGLKDKVNNHYLEIFGASIALGVIAGAAESTTYGNGYTLSGPSMYEQGMASSLSQSSADVLDRFINIPPKITIREGHRIKVYLTQDMLLPAYEDHDMPGVM
ncbi:MAG TPA: TrbI/VirB10 family protein [Alloacidobacterium sp.]|jgi:type IV secretion system protein VirB10|nr:TrbI/VirB10 family protein [Alloacidobacterium sp.]